MASREARREASPDHARRPDTQGPGTCRRGVWAWPTAVLLAAAPAADAAGLIEIEFRSAYNLVVDSNVCSPSTYAPQVATAGVGFCNYGDAPLTDVVARIGDFTAKTPGVYPTRDSSATGFNATCLAGSGLYSLSHLGDPVDAVRYIGDLAVGECSWQYWSFTYPRLENGQQPGSGCDSPVWCETNQTDDDLWLNFDVWATSAEGPARNATHTVTMRNEISASANKIYPNDGVWYTDPPYCLPGQSMTTNGINYELGVVNQGFDNDGDGTADYNAWLQPIGAAGWNPACFRLVRTSGQLTVGRPGNPTEYVDFEDQLYFTNLGDNNGITGVVYYQFMCLGGYCEAPMSPYQEAASGSDNEKFAGDYGASVGKLVVNPPSIEFDKTLADDPGASLPGIAEEGETLTFTMSIENTGAEALGSPDLGMPLVIRDSVPAGTAFVSGSADAAFACCPMPDGVKILFSWDHGVSWSSIEPPDPTAVTDLQWRLQAPLPAAGSGDVTFQVTVDTPYLGDPVILNTAAASFGDSAPFDEDTEGIPVAGPNSIGDTVFADDGGVPPDFLSSEANNGSQGGSEIGIVGVTVTLYWDRNGDGAFDSGDVAVASEETAAGGSYLFDNLRDGNWVVVADATDPQIPQGYRSSTGTEVAVSRLGEGDPNPVAYLDADFGFGPTLVVEKRMLGETSPTCLAPGSSTVSYDITVSNQRPADTQCNYTMWGQDLLTPDGKPWSNDVMAVGSPDGEFAIDDFSGAKDTLRLGGFSLSGTPPGTIQQVWAVAVVYVNGTLTDDNIFFEVFQGGASPIYTTAAIPYLAQCEDGADNDGDGMTDLYDPQCKSGEFGMENGSVSEAIEYLNPLPSNARLVAFDVTAALPGGWSYDDFASLQLQLVAQKFGSADGRLVYADAVGFRFTTDRLCGQPGDDLAVVPLEDQYDDTTLTFLAGSTVACSEDTDADGEVCGDADDRFFAPSSSSTCTGGPSATCEYPSAGILRWDDIGPLYAGESRTFRVTFATAASGTIQNTAMSCGPTGSGCQALFSDGTIANQHQDPAAVCALSPSYSIGDRVWHDANSNRVDDSEPGIPGVSVRLYQDIDNDDVYSPGVDVLLQATTTDSTGAYLFSNQVAGEYVVVVDTSTIPDTSLVQTYELDCPAGAGCTQNSQSAVTVTIANRLDVDFGYRVDNLVFGNVFFDFTVANGIWDGIDHGLEGWTVQLMRCNNSACGTPAVVGTTATDPAGFYLFGNAPNCTGNNLCYVRALPPAGVTQTADPDQPGVVCSACDSRTATFTLSGGTVRGAYDFGYTQSLANTVSTIGDTVFEDWNGDGAQGAGEGGIAGVTVYLYQDDGDGVFSPLTDTLRGTETTDASGQYLFSQMLDCGTNGVCEGGGDDTVLDAGFPAGQWFVWVDDTSLRATHQQTADPDESGACSHCNGIGTALTDGVSALLTQDFGYQPRGYASIGDYVWRDDDADGRQAASEPGIGSVLVSLYVDSNANGVVDAGDPLVATTLTDFDGSYLFENLYGGSAGNPVRYLVDVDQTDADIPRDCGADFDCATTGDNQPYVLTSGADPIAVTLTSNTASYRDADFGFARGGVIGDTIFNDFNGDGYQSGTDAGIPGVTVNLRYCGADGVCGNGDDVVTYRTTTTDANGNYAFVGLPGAIYRVEVDETSGGLPTYTPTYDRDVSPPACTVADPCDGQTRVVLGTGQTVLFADFGYQRLAGFVGDFVWYDIDGDGVQDADEPGLGGVEVCLQDCGAACQNQDPWTCQRTDPDGLYSFRLPSIAAGNRYTIRVTDSTLPDGAAEWIQTADPNGVPLTVSLEFQIDAAGLITTSGVTNPGLDFGFDRRPLPILTIDKDTSTPRSTAGGTVTFTMVARNPSTTSATRVRLRDDLTAWGSASCQPNCLTLADADTTPGCQVGQPTAVTISTDPGTVRQAVPAPVDPVCGANDLSWGYWTIAPGGFVSVQCTLDVASTITAGVYDNTALGGYDRDANGTEDTLFDDDGTVAQDADTPTAQDPETDEDVTIGVELAVNKTCSLAVDNDGDGRVDPNDQVLFTIDVQNTGVGDATIFSISDGVPLGTSYDTGSSELVSFRDWVNVAQYRDDFDAGSSTRETPPAGYVYPDGEDTVPSSESWATAWSDPCTGCTPAATLFDLGDLALQLRDKSSPRRSALAHGEAGQPGYATRATLSFDYRREAIDAADTLTVTACGTAVPGSPITGSGADTTDTQYLHFSVDMTSLLPAAAGNCQIVFETSNLGADEAFLIDNVQLERKERVTRPQGADPVPYPADPPPLLVPAADDRELLPGETMMAAFTVTADDPLPIGLGSIQNTVAVQASERADPVTDTCSLPVELPPNPGSIAGTVWEDVEATPDGVLDAGEPFLENVRIELYSGDCASSCTLAAVTLTDAAGNYLFSDLPSGSYTLVVADWTLPPAFAQSGDYDEASPPRCSTCDGSAFLTGARILQPGESRTGVDFGYYHQIVPLPVTLASFSAEGDPSQVSFTWTTATETGNVGFLLYGLVDDDWVPLGEGLVPSHVVSSIEPQQYELQLSAVGTEIFLLADVDVRGKTRYHGPFSLGVPVGVDVKALAKPIRWEVIGKQHVARWQARERHRRSRSQIEVRLTVKQDGLYRVSYEELLVQGLDLAGVPLAQLALLDRLGPVPILVEGRGRFGPGAAIVFAGQALDSLYTDTHVYTLRVDLASALRVRWANGRPPRRAGVTTTYQETVRIENDRSYHHGATNGDPWYDQALIAFRAPVTVNVPVPLDHLAPGRASLTVGTWGMNDWPESPDHHLRVSLNEIPVADELFDGFADHPVTVGLTDGMLREGGNDVALTLPFDQGVAWDLIALDSTTITYPRYLVARAGQLRFTAEAEALRVDGLPGPEVTVFRQRGGEVHVLRRVEVSGTPGAYSATFAGSPEPATFLVATAGSFLTPGIEPAPPRTDITEGSAQYLIVSHADFIEGLAPLVAAREQTMSVKVVDVDDVYASFGGGNVDPEAIRDYVKVAVQRMGTEYLLLVGGDTVDYKNVTGLDSVSFIPSIYAATHQDVQFAPADPLYGDVDGDRVPDIAVGRLPVRTADELETVIAKTLAYAQKDYGRTLLSVSDGYDAANELSFLDASDDLLARVDPSWSVARADVDTLGASAARSRLISTINQGVALVQYIGHSGHLYWSQSSLLSTAHAAQLQNAGRPAVIAQWGCWNTYYVLPGTDTLGQTLLLSGDRGAAAVLGATSLTTNASHLELGIRLFPKAMTPGATLGQAVLEAKRELAAVHPEMVDVIIGWSLLGDPALVLAGDVSP